MTLYGRMPLLKAEEKIVGISCSCCVIWLKGLNIGEIISFFGKRYIKT
jgi:hypothetical protein